MFYGYHLIANNFYTDRMRVMTYQRGHIKTMFRKLKKTMFSRESGTSNKKNKKSTIKGDVIVCHDCGEKGYRVPDFDSWEYEIPFGWMPVYVGFKLRYLCPSCVIKRREFGEKILREVKPNMFEIK